mgnify:CR=1 FL=1
MAFAVVRDAEQAEDLTQEVFCRVLRHLDDYMGRGQFFAYLRRITLNLARNAVRDRVRQAALLHAYGRDLTPRPDPLADPVTVLDSHLLSEEVRAALKCLTAEQREGRAYAER